jgi:hypothetical protein
MNTRQKIKIRVEFVRKGPALWDYVARDFTGKALTSGTAYGTQLEIRRAVQFQVDKRAADAAAVEVTP